MTVFHYDIYCDIFFIDFVVEVADYVNIIHAYEGVDFIYYVLFLFR